MSLFSGVLLGCVYGVVNSSKANMQAFNELGPDYLLGRIAREEELQWASEDQLAETQGLVK